MKKSLSILLAGALAFGSFASLASAADPVTPLEKFNYLQEQKIFKGIDSAGTPALDRAMNRAEFARVSALLLKLEGIGDPDTLVVTEKPFKDVEIGANVWYKEEVTAVKKNGIMVGNPDGTFKPASQITVQELAVVAAKLLGLKEVANAKVEGASDWAAGWIQAILNEGIIFPTNYKKAATRADLVNVSYTVYQELNVPATVTIASTTQTGAKKITVAFNKEVDTSKATFTVKRGTITVNVDPTKTAWNNDKKSVTLEGFTNFIEGDYTVTVSGLTEAALTGTAKVEASKVKSITFNNDVLAQTGATTAAIGYKVTNQFNEEINNTPVSAFTSATSISAANGTATVTFPSNIVVGTTIASVTLVDNNTGVSAAGSFKVSAAAQADVITVGELKNKDNKVLRTNSNLGNDTWEFDVTVKDQYGSEIPGSAFGAVNNDVLISTSHANLTAAFVNVDGKLKLRITGIPNNALNAGTHTIILVSKATGKSTVVSVKIEAPISAKTFTLLPPADMFVQNESTYVPFEAVDQYGNKLTKYDDLGGVTLSVSDSTNASVVLEKNPVNGEGRVKVTVGPNFPENTNLYVYATIAAEGKNSSISGKVNADAIPTRISGVKADAGYVNRLVKGGAQTDLNTGDFQLKDQYDRNIDIEGNYSIVLEPADGNLNTVTTSTYRLGFGGGATATITAGANAGSETLTATLYNNNAAVANSAVSIPLTVVEKSAIASYVIDTAEKLYAPSGTTQKTYAGTATAAEKAYAKGISIYGQDSAGNKIALVAGDVINKDSTNGNVEFTTDGKVFAQKVADASKDEAATIVVVVNGANGTQTATKTITLTNAAPVAGELVVKGTAGTFESLSEGVAVVTVAQMNAQNNKIIATNLVGAGTRTNVYFEVKDQYDVASAAVAPRYFTISAKDSAGNAKATYNISNTSGSNGVLTAASAAAGDEITVTAIMNDGKTKTIKFIVVT